MRLSIDGLKTWVTEQALVPRPREGGTRLLDALYPRQTLNHDPDLCNSAWVPDAVQVGDLTADDKSAIRVLTAQGCDMCARPFEGGLFLGAGAFCDGCTQKAVSLSPLPCRLSLYRCIQRLDSGV